MSIQTSYFPFFGGLDLVSAALSVKDGTLAGCKNYEVSTVSGYKRMLGYERFDGRTSPSSLVESDYADRTTWIAAIETARTPITEVPGEGGILGVWHYNDTCYAFRNKVGGASAGMYKSTAAGWVEVTTGVTLNPDGRYEFVNYNFYASSGLACMYGCDGVNKAFEYDGTTFTQITTGMTVDTPTHIEAHKKYLFLAFAGGSLQISPIGDPTGTWTAAVTPATEIGMGDDITGIQSTQGDSLAIFSRNSIHILYGSSGTDWTLKPFSSQLGALGYSTQRLQSVIFLDDYGVTRLDTAQTYGDFKTTSMTSAINPLLESKRGKLIASVVIRNKDQYRLYFNDKSVITLSFKSGKMIGISTQLLDNQPTCVCSSEDSSGREVAFFGSDNGFVYQMEKGNSFDGASIESWLRLNFSNFRSPQNKKRFFKFVLELETSELLNISFLPIFNYGDPNSPDSIPSDSEIIGGGGSWGDLIYGDFVWGAQLVGEAYGYIDGLGKTVSLYIRNDSNYEKPHTLQGAIFHYSVKGISR